MADTKGVLTRNIFLKNTKFKGSKEEEKIEIKLLGQREEYIGMVYIANISKLYTAYWKLNKITLVIIKKNPRNLIHLTKFQVYWSVLVYWFARTSEAYVYVYIKNISYLKSLLQFQNSTFNPVSTPLNSYSRIIFYF